MRRYSAAGILSSRNRPLQADAEVGYGTFFDGRRTRVELSVEWRPSHHWFLELEYEFKDIRLPRGNSPTHEARFRVNRDVAYVQS